MEKMFFSPPIGHGSVSIVGNNLKKCTKKVIVGTSSHPLAESVHPIGRTGRNHEYVSLNSRLLHVGILADPVNGCVCLLIREPCNIADLV